MFRFASPALLWLLLVIPAYLVVAVRYRRRLEPAVSFPLTRLAREQAGSSAVWKRAMALLVRCIVLALVITGLARPQAGRGNETVLSEGIDILLVLDVSGSMRAEDFKPQNRLAVAKSVVAEFIDGRISDRIGMVVFACGYILFYTSNVLRHYRVNQHVAAALALFSAVALLFWYILQIFMSRR